MAANTQTLYTFSPSLTPIFIENITLRPNGHLLLTTFRAGSLYGLDPLAEKPEAYLVVQISAPASLSIGEAKGEKLAEYHLTGIAQIASPRGAAGEAESYVITAGIERVPMGCEKGSVIAVRVDLGEHSSSSSTNRNPHIETIATFPDSELQNGMTSLPASPSTGGAGTIVLSVDSIQGRVFRLNTATQELDVVLQHEDLMPLPSASGKVPLGVNGIKYHPKDGYLYLSNSARELMLRVHVDARTGDVLGALERLVTNEGAAHAMPYDDFDIDGEGNIYVCVHPRFVFRIQAGTWRQTLFAEGGKDGEGEGIQSPTSCVVSSDESKLYVSCAGRLARWDGRVVEVELR